MIKLSGLKPMYIEKCKEWLRELLRTSKRQKKSTAVIRDMAEANDEEGGNGERGEDNGIE